ncbi:MAG: cadherin repeat domain-containing protein [Verrucomicrobia bacterium]|nr:cadherin repeat domain-containing protein [Verrucomicrobiota bacterium]
MTSESLQHVRHSAVFLGAVFLLGAAVPDARAQYGGLFVNATPQTPVQLGQPLNITVVVRNTTTDVWEPGTEEYSWLTQADNPSWFPGAQPLAFATQEIVEPGATATMILTFPSTVLPDSPGNYSVRLMTAYNWLDLLPSVMDGSPKTVNFSITSPPTNHAPVITPVGTKVVVETNLLSFTVLATDADLPQQKLTFSLEPGAPVGAGINPTNGLFTWTPPAGSAPGTNQFTVRVTDDGSPPMSATNVFDIVVLPPPRFEPFARPANGVATLVWRSYPGKTYRVQYRDDLVSGSWTNFESDFTATDFLTSVTNNLGGARQRFYRMMLVD